MSKQPQTRQPLSPEVAEYWRVHSELITVLNMIGLGVPVQARLPLFWLYSQLDKVYGDAPQELRSEALALVEKCTAMRIAGAEPKFNGNMYL